MTHERLMSQHMNGCSGGQDLGSQERATARGPHITLLIQLFLLVADVLQAMIKNEVGIRDTQLQAKAYAQFSSMQTIPLFSCEANSKIHPSSKLFLINSV